MNIKNQFEKLVANNYEFIFSDPQVNKFYEQIEKYFSSLSDIYAK